MIERQEVDSPIEEMEALSNLPYQSSIEAVLIPEPELPRKQLPERLTRDIPKLTYECDLSSRVKYPMSHYLFLKNLSKSN